MQRLSFWHQTFSRYCCCCCCCCSSTKRFHHLPDRKGNPKFWRNNFNQFQKKNLLIRFLLFPTNIPHTFALPSQKFKRKKYCSLLWFQRMMKNSQKKTSISTKSDYRLMLMFGFEVRSLVVLVHTHSNAKITVNKRELMGHVWRQ